MGTRDRYIYIYINLLTNLSSDRRALCRHSFVFGALRLLIRGLALLALSRQRPVADSGSFRVLATTHSTANDRYRPVSETRRDNDRSRLRPARVRPRVIVRRLQPESGFIFLPRARAAGTVDSIIIRPRRVRSTVNMYIRIIRVYTYSRRSRPTRNPRIQSSPRDAHPRVRIQITRLNPRRYVSIIPVGFLADVRRTPLRTINGRIVVVVGRVCRRRVCRADVEISGSSKRRT